MPRRGAALTLWYFKPETSAIMHTEQHNCYNYKLVQTVLNPQHNEHIFSANNVGIYLVSRVAEYPTFVQIKYPIEYLDQHY